MKKHRLLFLWFSLLLCAVGARANEITVNEGTVENSSIPLYGLYVDNFFVSQFIIPAGDLPSGATFSSMTFATKDASYDWGSFTCEVFLGEVDETSFPSTDATIYDWSTLTKVYEGSPAISDYKMVIGFSSDYSYGGGNLLVGFKITSKSNGYKSTYWYGVESTGGAISGYNSGSVEAINNYSVKNFLPQVTFEYTGGTTIIPKPTNLAVSLTPGDGSRATLSWTENGTATEWEICLLDDMDNLQTATTNPYELFPITPETTYTAKVRAVVGEERSNWSNTVTFTPTNAYQITVNDGTGNNNFVPIYGYWADGITKSQFIIPAESLADMLYGSIEKMTFYASQASVNWGAAEFEVYVTEVNNTVFESTALTDYSGMDKVKNAGTLSISDNKMVVTLDYPYQYMGGNLMIGFLQTTKGSFSTSTWLGTTQTGTTALGGYGTTINAQQFLPKTTFDFTPGEAPSCFKPTDLAVNYEGGTTAVVSWTSDASAWNLDVNGDIISVTENPYTLDNIELATIYEVKVQADCGGSTSDWTAPATFITDICLPEDQCEISYTLTDSYGDGWTNNAISVVDKETGVEVAHLTLASGNSDEGTIALCHGRTYTFTWVLGSYAGECSYVFYDVNGEEIFSGEGVLDDTDYTMDCTVDACPKPKDITVAPGYFNATISWTGSSESYNLQYRPVAKGEVLFSDGFEDGLDNWTVLTNGEGNGWRIIDASQFTDGSNHSGSAVAMTRSWEGNSIGGVNADNWLISPEVDLGGTLEYWAKGDGAGYDETYAILVSTKGTDPDDFEDLITFTTNPATWEKVTVDLSAYRGESGYIAFHHVDYDKDYLWIDDVKIYGPAGEEEEWIPVTTEETSVELTDLEMGTEYEYQVQGVCSGTPGDWTNIASFTTLDESTKTFVSDGFWNEDENWFPAGVPTGTEDVIVKAIASIPSGFLAKAKTVTIEEGGSIIIYDGGQFKHSSEDAVEVTLEKFFFGYDDSKEANRYYLVGPVSNVDPSDVGGLLEGNYGFYQFDSAEPLEWRSYDETTFDMVQGKGYLYANQEIGTLHIPGESVSNDLGYGYLKYSSVPYTASDDDYNGWVLLSNPYTCNMEVVFGTYSSGWSLENSTFYKLNADGDGFDIYQDVTALAPGEAAFIKIDQAGYVLYFSEEFLGDGEGDVNLEDYVPVGSTLLPFLPKHEVTGDQDANLLLEDGSYDNSALLAEFSEQEAPVVLKGRTLFRDTKWNTICLPFDVTLEGSVLEGAIVKPLSDVTVADKHISLSFGDPVAEIAAGVPYIIKWETAGDDIVDPSFGWVTINDGKPESQDFCDGNLSFVGYYDAWDITPEENSDIWYLKADNTLTHTGKPRTLKAFRTYFVISEDLSSGVDSFSLDFGDGETATGITEIADSSAPEGYFNLQGVKFDKAPKQKGVYIVNGKKVVVK